ncbi:MAG: PEP-CTERM sorting domain-containing protein [Sphingomonas sp.]|nr:MAG: PEP-CTERM sorting domain-containing protein [Sphingomonas sp.]
MPCPPAFVNAPIVPQSTFAAAVPPDGATSNYLGSPSSAGVIVGGAGPGGNVGGGGGNPGPGGGTGPGAPGGGGGESPLPAVPEPATWSMMLLGFGLLGAALRSRAPAKVPVPVPANGARRRGSRHSLRRRRSAGIAGGGILWSLLEPVQAMTAGVGGGSKMSLLAKAAMCVCPPALMVTAVATVPQARKAVFAATAPQVPAGAPAAITPPCDPNIPVVTGV